MMTGFLASQGFRVSQNRVGLALQRVHPHHHSCRRNTVHCQVNPIPYTATQARSQKFQRGGSRAWLRIGLHGRECALLMETNA